VTRTHPLARTLAERFCPTTGRPLRIGQVWPPRLVLHDCEQTHGAETIERLPTAFVRHVLREPVEVTIHPSDEPAVDSSGMTVSGLEVGRVRSVVASGRSRGLPLLPGEDAATYKGLRLPVRWEARLARDIERGRWVRQALFVEFTEGRVRRTFLWYLYLVSGPARLPEDDLPHYRWVDEREGPLRVPGVARHWVELPAPMSSPTLPPACWVQPTLDASGSDPALVRGAGPSQVELVCTWPVESPLPPAVEAVGWNGALGGLDPRPAVQPLAVDATPIGRGAAGAEDWQTWFTGWDTPQEDQSRGVRHLAPTLLEPPTNCVWPTVWSEDERPLQLFDLSGQRAPTPPADASGARGDGQDRSADETEHADPLPPRRISGVEVLTNLRVTLPDAAEAVRLERGVLRLGTEVVGRWDEGPLEVHAGSRRNLRCIVDLSRLRAANDGRLKLTFAFQGRPTRGVVTPGRALEFRTGNGPYVKLTRGRSEGVRTPWLVIDLGTEGTCAAVAFLDGFVPRVTTVMFDEGPIYPSKVWLSQAQGGVYALTDEPAEDALYTTLVKLGLRFGDGAHPGCPDHIAATEVARFFLKRFLVEVRERTAWFPLAESDVLVSFPPRLAAMPRFVRSLKETFQSVLEEVVWPEGRARKLVFREEAFLVAVPSLYRDLQLTPLSPGTSRYYWVMDFGGGTTDVCGFLVTPDGDAEEHTVTHLTYPQRMAHHLSGNDVTRAFYSALLLHLYELELVAAPDAEEGDGRRYPLPSDPFPSARSTPTALLNQTALRELADAVKCVDLAADAELPLRSIAGRLPTAMLRTIDGAETSLRAMLSNEAGALGDLRVAELHGRVLDPTLRSDRSPDPTQKTVATCQRCQAPKVLPYWLFASNRAFRYRCERCGSPQRVQVSEQGLLSDDGDEGTPVLTAWRDRTATVDSDLELYLEQDGRTYVLRDRATLERWIEERRVSGTDRFSEDGTDWVPLKEHPEYRVRLRQAEEISVDTTQEVPANRWQKWMFPEPSHGGGPQVPHLGRDIRLFLDGCREALERAVENLPAPERTEVVVLVAGRGSQFGPIAEGIHAFLPGRVVHLTNDWVRKSFGQGGQIDPNADLKTMTVNGGGLFALLQSNPETSQLLLSVDTSSMEIPVYLQSAMGARPWLITTTLEARIGGSVTIVQDKDEITESTSETVEEPPPRPLPLDTALTGDLQLVVDGLPEDRSWEPYVVIAQGTARRRHGRRARTVPETALRTEEKEFVLAPLTQDLEVRFTRMLPRLPLLGGD
jgi:hypothetical protein